MLEAQQATLSQSNWSANAQNGTKEEAPGGRESFGQEAEDVGFWRSRWCRAVYSYVSRVVTALTRPKTNLESPQVV